MEPNRPTPRSHHAEPLFRGGWLVFSILLSLASIDLHAAGLAGRPLQDALKDFQAAGMRLIFSSQVVTDEMRVGEEPRGATAEDRLRSILLPHGLMLAPVPGGAWAIVAADASARAAARLAAEQHPGHGVAAPRGATDLNAIVVETSRFGLGNRSFNGESDLPRSSMETVVGTDEDVARAIQQLPGTASGGVSARTHVRGSRDDETVYRFDGIELIDPFHLKDFQSLFSAIDPEVSESVRFWSGDFPVDDASVIGGVVDVQPRRITKPAIEAGLSMLNTSMLLATPIAGGRGSILLNGRVSNLVHVARALKTNIGQPDFQDGTARVTWQFTPATQLVGGILALNDSLTLFTTSPAQQAFAHYNDIYSWIKLHHDWSARIASETIYSTVVLDSARTARIDRPGIDRGNLDEMERTTSQTLRQELAITASDHVSFRIGAQASRANTQYSFQSHAQYEPPFAPYISASRAQYGLPFAAFISGSVVSDVAVGLPAKYSTRNGYASVRWRPSDDSVLEFGIRRDGQNFEDGSEHSQWNSRINVLQRIAPKTVLRLGWGQYSQPQAINGLDVGDGLTNLQRARRLTQATLSVEQEFGSGWLLRAAAYDKREQSPAVTQENIFSFLTLAPEIEVDRFTVKSQSGRMRGIEISISSDVHRPLSGWLTYTHSRAFDRIGGLDIPRSWDQPDALQVGLLWKRRAWILSGLLDWHTGWPFTPLVASATTWQDPSQVTLMLGPRNSQRQSSFKSVDLRAVWRHPLRFGTFETSFELRNAFNYGNICCREYQVIPASGGRSQLLEDNRDFLPLTPIVGVRWRL